MSDYPKELARWLEALRAHARSLETYASEITSRLGVSPAGPAGGYSGWARHRQTFRSEAAAAEAALDAASRAAPPGDDSRSYARAAQLFGLVGDLEAARAALGRASEAALEPNVAQEAARAPSRTRSDELDRLGRGVRKAAESAASARRAGIAASARYAAEPGALVPSAGDLGGALAEVGAAFHAAVTESGGAPAAPAAEIYAGVLRLCRERGAEVGAAGEAAKMAVLGAPAPRRPDRHTLHPLQAMGLTFALTPRRAANAPPLAKRAAVIDATLPQAVTAVAYDLAPLVDPRAAGEGGRVPTRGAGLDYRTVARFRTIVRRPRGRPEEAAPAPPGCPEDAAPLPGALPELYRTTDAGATFARLDPGPGAPPPRAAEVCAGPAPSVERLGELLSEALAARPGARLESATVRRLTAGRPGETRRPLIPVEALRRALETHFERAALPEGGSGPGRTLASFREAIAGTAGEVPPYVEAAVSALYERAAALREGDRVRGRPLFAPGDMGAFVRAARREALLTFAAQSQQTALGVARRMRKALTRFVAQRGKHYLESLLGDAGGDAGRLRLLGAFREIAADATPDSRGAAARGPGGAPRPLEKEHPIEPPLTPKEDLLERGGALAAVDRL